MVVTLAYGNDRVRIQVTNDGEAAPPDGVVIGHGLAGMRARSALYHGEFRAGPTHGGWELFADLALTDQAGVA